MKVINIKKHTKEQPYVYIGRPSMWGNPFVIGKDGTRRQVIEKYEQYIKSRPDLLSNLHALVGKNLGCYCSPLPCHGDVLVKLCKEFYQTSSEVSDAGS